MDVQQVYTTNFRYKTTPYHAVVKVTSYFNGYRIAKVIVDREQHWALYDGISWKLMADMRKNELLDKLILKYLKTIIKRLSNLTQAKL